VDEGITDCQWRSLDEALELLSYDNARGVLKRAGEMVRTLVAIGAGRPKRGGGTAERRNGATTETSVPVGRDDAPPAGPVEQPTAVPPYRHTAD
jgi:hypothetical protein